MMKLTKKPPIHRVVFYYAGSLLTCLNLFRQDLYHGSEENAYAHSDARTDDHFFGKKCNAYACTNDKAEDNPGADIILFTLFN
jgi:hypothetical protein